tara:strand:- start:436 stop:804 length:369 start_codon:yes stop_codon:yes gene_type:complete
MTDLKIPNLNKNSDKFLFKKKSSLRRKSKRKLIHESYIMLFISFLIIYLNYLIPNKTLIFQKFINNFEKVTVNVSNSLTYFFEICLAIFIVFSLSVAFLLIFGAFSRVLKVLKRRSRQITFK